MRVVLVLLALLLTGCPSSSTPADGTNGGFDSGTTGPHGPPCAGAYCAVGEECCLATGLCYAPSNQATACPTPPNDGSLMGQPCASNADCDQNSFCGESTCIGQGRCTPRDGCMTTCVGCPPPPPVCGCNGITYATLDEACRAGVRVSAANGACGQGDVGSDAGTTDPDAGGSSRPDFIPCGGDSQCPAGDVCCGRYGICVPADCTWCCQPPPAGTSFPCGDDSWCNLPAEYCAGDGCGTPGGCRTKPSMLECSGEVATVCGCDGRTYTNRCWAESAGTRVAADGPCRDQ